MDEKKVQFDEPPDQKSYEFQDFVGIRDISREETVRKNMFLSIIISYDSIENYSGCLQMKYNTIFLFVVCFFRYIWNIETMNFSVCRKTVNSSYMFCSFSAQLGAYKVWWYKMQVNSS